MNKYISTCLLICTAPSALANVGSGFYASVGVGGGFVDIQNLQSFDLDYPTLYEDNFPEQDLSEAVNNAFYDTAQYSNGTGTVVAGRAAVGYLWDFFEGEPTQIGTAVYTFNTTLGLEFGYRLFDNVTDSLTEVEFDNKNVPPFPHCPTGRSPAEGCTVYEQANTKTELQAFDVLAVLRLPFTEDNALALLLKGGVAYNLYKMETTIDVNVDSEEAPTNPPYDNTYYLNTIKHDEFLPSLGAGLEYMIFENLGVAVEYNAIFASSHDANSQLLTGNIILRL